MRHQLHVVHNLHTKTTGHDVPLLVCDKTDLLVALNLASSSLFLQKLWLKDTDDLSQNSQNSTMAQDLKIKIKHNGSSSVDQDQAQWLKIYRSRSSTKAQDLKIKIKHNGSTGTNTKAK